MKCFSCDVNYAKNHNYVIEVYDGPWADGRRPDRVYEYFARDTAAARVAAELLRDVQADVVAEKIEYTREPGKTTTTYRIAHGRL